MVLCIADAFNIDNFSLRLFKNCQANVMFIETDLSTNGTVPYHTEYDSRQKVIVVIKSFYGKVTL